MGPGEHLVVWCDNDADQGPPHAPFALARGGESAVLSTNEAILDQIDFGPQDTDVSLARVLDGSDRWQFCQSPTPGDRNNCPDAPLATATDKPTPVATAPPTPTAVPAYVTYLPALLVAVER